MININGSENSVITLYLTLQRPHKSKNALLSATKPTFNPFQFCVAGQYPVHSDARWLSLPVMVHHGTLAGIIEYRMKTANQHVYLMARF